MKAFLDDNFLLKTKTAQALYHDVAEKMPIIDYHCHLNPKEIWDNVRFDNITQVWLGGDHYKWRLMRCAGVEERYITGDAPDDEKFFAWAKVLGRAVGNPLYHWSHLELRRYFGYQGVLNERTAKEVWDLCNEKLKTDDFCVRALIQKSGVEVICTTDDPVDTLAYHALLQKDAGFPVAVLPTWRPDKAMNLDKANYLEYLSKLEAAAGIGIATFADLKKALRVRLDHFQKHGCKISDHGIGRVVCEPYTQSDIEAIFAKRLRGVLPTARERDQFQTAFLTFLAEQYTHMNWGMQLHYGCRRDNNTVMFEKLGPDTGFDAVDNSAPSNDLAAFLGELEGKGILPRTVIYSLNTFDNQAIDTICGCFQNAQAVSKIQHGSAWWFNDHYDGMREQMKSLANLGYLAGFVGMLTDSRSFLSYPRHEYFRRILCELLGDWVEDGMFPNDETALRDIVEGVCYRNAKAYFHF